MKIEQIWQGLTTEKVIGKGSYGTVYRCFRENNGEKTYSAVKVISIPQTGEEYYGYNTEGMTIEQTKEYYRDIVDDFANEIKILESLKGNKNIVEIRNYKVIEKTEEIGWEIFIEMELLTDFNTYASDKVFTEEEVLKLGTDLCNALSVCNSKNIIHRDIKPENIFVSDNGDFKLGDFGVSRQLEKTDASMSRKGTFNYMAPEVFYSKKYDSRADVYSLGLVMYKLLNNNRMPFLDSEKQIVKYSERQEAFDKRINGEKVPPIKGISDELNEVILKACEYKAEDRYNSSDEFRKALEKRKLTGFAGWIYRNKLVVRASVIALVVLSLSVSVAIALKFGNDNQDDIGVDGEDSGFVDYSYMESGDVYTKNPVNGKYVYTNNEGVFIFDEQTEKTTQLYDEESYAPAFDGFGICFVSDKVVYQTTEDSKKPDKVYTAKDFDLSRIVYFDGECIVAITSEESEKPLYSLMFIDIASESYEEIAILGYDDYALYANGNVIYLENATANVAGCKMYAYNVGNRESVLLSEEVFADEDFAMFSDGQLNYLSKTDESELKVMTCSFDAQVNEDVTKEIKFCKDVIWWDGNNVIYVNEDGKVNIYNIETETAIEVKEDIDEVYTCDGKYYAFEKFTDGYRLNEVCADGNIKASMYTDNIKNKFDVIALKKDAFLSWNKDSATFASVKTNEIDPLITDPENKEWNKFFDDFVECFYVVGHSSYDYKKFSSDTLLLRGIISCATKESGIYEHYFGKNNEISYSEKKDPLNKFAEDVVNYPDPGRYRVYSIDKINWIIKNIFNVEANTITDFTQVEEEFLLEYKTSYNYEGNYYFQVEDGGDGGVDTDFELIDYNANVDGTYDVSIAVYDGDGNYATSLKTTVSLKLIDGEKYWSVYRIFIDGNLDSIVSDSYSSHQELPNKERDRFSVILDDSKKNIVGIEMSIYGTYTHMTTDDEPFGFAEVLISEEQFLGYNDNNEEIYSYMVENYSYCSNPEYNLVATVKDDEYYPSFILGGDLENSNDVTHDPQRINTSGYEVDYQDDLTTIKLYFDKSYSVEEYRYYFDVMIYEGVLYNTENGMHNYENSYSFN